MYQKDLLYVIKPSQLTPDTLRAILLHTVTLAANGETATYDEVTATTAANTLVLGKGVTVNTLKVKAGNVRVKSGAKVTAISRAQIKS